MKSKKLCDICEQNNWLPLYKNLIKCKYCGLIRSDDKFFILNPAKLYDINYFNGKDYVNYQEEEIALSKNFKNRIEEIRKFKKNGKLLDVGCAYGFFLKIAKESGYNAEGVEINKKVASVAKKNSNCRIHVGNLGKLNLKKYDIITMFDVIEHLKNPAEYIQKCYKLLNKDGLLIIETGNIESSLARLQKVKWRLIVPNIHLYYFSNFTLSKLLTTNGFRLVKTKNVGFIRTIGQTYFRLTRQNLKLSENISNISFSINTKDLIFVIAKK